MIDNDKTLRMTVTNWGISLSYLLTSGEVADGVQEMLESRGSIRMIFQNYLFWVLRMSKLLVPSLKIFLRKISGNSIELHTDDLSEILELQNLSQNLSQNPTQNQTDFWKVNRIEPQPSNHFLLSFPPFHA